MKEEKSHTKVMRLNRFLSNKYVVGGLCVLEDLLLFFFLNYVINLVFNIPVWLEDLDHAENYIGLSQMLPDFGRIGKYPFPYLIGLAVALAINGITIYQIHVSLSEKNFNAGQRGVARWTTNKEIKEQYKEIPDRDYTFPGAGGTIISRIGKKLYIDQSPTNNLIIGITRSGKGEMFVFPSIDVYSRAEEKTSLVVCDPKLELYKGSKKTLERRGYQVYLLNLDDPLHSMGFNPLEQIKEEYLKKHYAEAELLAQSFSFSIFNPNSPTNTDAFWQDTASSLLTALILAHIEDCLREDEEMNEKRFREWKEKRERFDQLTNEEKQQIREAYPRQKEKILLQGGDPFLSVSIQAIPDEEVFFCSNENEKKINMYSIINTFTELARMKNPKNPDLSALDSYFSERPMLDRAKLKYAGIEVAGDRTKGSIFASMLVKLTIFTFENIAKMTAESSLKLEEVGFGDKPVAVFLGIPDYDKSTHFLATVFIRQLTFVLEKKATRMKSGRCTRKVKFICDEFGNLPAIEGMESIITVCLGRNISYDLYIQAYSQVQKLYGDDSETIIGNCGNQVYILTNDDKTAENFSKNLGNETIIDIQRSGDKLSTKKHFTETMIEKPLLNMNELEELREGECVVKRVMKRQDLERRRIRPTPIFNSEESGKRFLYRYEYLTDTFPNPDSVDLREVNTEDRSWIDHRERVWDYNRSFDQLLRKRKEAVSLVDLYNKKEIKELLQKLLSAEEYQELTDEMPVTRLIDLISRSGIRIKDKQAVIQLIEMSAA